MRPSLKTLLFSLSILGAASAQAMEDTTDIMTKRTTWRNFSEYQSDMNTRGLPHTLIIACGHQKSVYSLQIEQDHTHPNCWCVDIAEHDSQWPTHSQRMGEQPTTSHWQEIGANAELNITNPIIPQEYRNKFDIVVVERPGPKTINNFWTIFNAAQMVKVGGELTIACSADYPDLTYEPDFNDERKEALNRLLSGPPEALDNSHRQFNLFTTVDSFGGHGGMAIYYYGDNGYEAGNSRKNKLYLQDIIRAAQSEHLYGENFNPDNICKKLETFDIKTGEKDPISFSPERKRITMNIGNYLANWYFTDIVALGSAYLPHGHLRTSLVSATKTRDTQMVMTDWLRAVRAASQQRRDF